MKWWGCAVTDHRKQSQLGIPNPTWATRSKAFWFPFIYAKNHKCRKSYTLLPFRKSYIIKIPPSQEREREILNLVPLFWIKSDLLLLHQLFFLGEKIWHQFRPLGKERGRASTSRGWKIHRHLKAGWISVGEPLPWYVGEWKKSG